MSSAYGWLALPPQLLGGPLGESPRTSAYSLSTPRMISARGRYDFGSLRFLRTTPEGQFGNSRWTPNLCWEGPETASVATVGRQQSSLISRVVQLKRAKDLFSDFGDYQCPGWDGYEGEAITAETIRRAIELVSESPFGLPMPHAAPSGDGSIGLEWSHGKAQYFVDITSDGEVLTYLDSGVEAPTKERFQWGEPRLQQHFEETLNVLFGGYGDSGVAWTIDSDHLSMVAEAYFPEETPGATTYGSDTSTTSAIFDRMAPFTTAHLVDNAAA